LEKVPVQDVVERVVGALQLQAAQRNIQLTANVPASIPLIEADQALLQQALQNLVENAVKYTRPEGKVHVDVKNQPIGVVFSIKDTGIGISPMDQPRLFERFFRGAQHASREERGTGLGLTIVKSIADRHGGKVWADSQLGKGSIFYLAIPITQPRPENEPQNVEKV
jgi:signal transduction histidine kinase